VYFRTVRWWLLALLAAGCGGSDASPEKRGPHAIVVLGSSTAAGIGPSDPANTWTARYEAQLAAGDPACQLHNLAVGGYTTYQIQADDFVPPPGRPAPAPGHNITAAIALGPSAVIVNLPSNDQAYRYGTDEQLENYDRVAALTSEHGIALWVTTSQPRNFTSPDQLAALFAARDAIVDKFGERSIDFWTDLAEPDGTIVPEYDSGDGIHLNDAAHAILADRVAAQSISKQAPP
jgi:lysophospholipase L1-like esterase